VVAIFLTKAGIFICPGLAKSVYSSYTAINPNFFKFREGNPMSKPFLNGKRNLKIGVFFLLALLSAGPVGAAEILEYLTPSPDSSPSDLAFDAQGNLWFTEINGNKIGKLVPSETEPGTSKGIQEYELPNPNSKPNYLIVSKDGQVWFSEMAGRIGKLDPVTGKISEYPVP
ncbi:uncharacterized protein METZ01_LOCUS472048, partial [marine metagenome]